VDRFIYLGSAFSRFSAVFVTRRKAALDNLEKLRGASGTRIGADSVGHHHYIVGRLFAWITGLKEPRFVTGYSGPEVDLALLRGEVDARSQGGHSIIARTPDWIEKGLVHFHAVFEIPRGFSDPEFIKRFAELTGAEAFPLMPDEKALAVREIPRDAATIKLFNRIAGTDPLPPS
jgi:hypothetical protein